MSDSELLPEKPHPAETGAARSGSSPGKGTKAVPATKRPRSVFDDPVVRTMAWIAGGLLVLYASGIIAALYFGIIGSTAPKTMFDRNLGVMQSKIDNGDKTPGTWAAYITLLIQQRQFTKAQQAVDRALKIVDQSAGADVTIAQANLYLAQKNFKPALASADAAMKIIKDTYDKEMLKKDTTMSRSFGLNENYYEAVLLKADVYQLMGDSADELAALTLYLKNTKGDTTVMLRRAKVREKTGDAAGAIADYKSVLKFDPTNTTALQGLKQIGSGQ